MSADNSKPLPTFGSRWVELRGSAAAALPVALVETVLTAFSDPGDLIYIPFCGSSTQIVAAERAGRRCFAMNLSPAYCDVAVRRREMASGLVAALKIV